jgi:hypothetical protein
VNLDLAPRILDLGLELICAIRVRSFVSGERIWAFRTFDAESKKTRQTLFFHSVQRATLFAEHFFKFTF